MNKQELIGKIKSADTIYLFLTPFIEKKLILDLVKQLDEPQKVQVPQFVAGWMNYCKLTGVDLYHAFEMGDLYLGNYAYQKDYPKLKGYFESENNQETFARAWLDGYTVKKEKRYRVKAKGVYHHSSVLKLDSITGRWFFGNEKYMCGSLEKHTRKELEEANFGWVFDCPGMEVEEIEGEI